MPVPVSSVADESRIARLIAPHALPPPPGDDPGRDLPALAGLTPADQAVGWRAWRDCLVGLHDDPGTWSLLTDRRVIEIGLRAAAEAVESARRGRGEATGWANTPGEVP